MLKLAVFTDQISQDLAHAFPEAAKWLMSFAMLMGRLELIAVIVVFLPRFWRA